MLKREVESWVLYTVFTNGGHVGKNWWLVMKARRWRINKNCKWRLSVNLQSVLARIPPKITLYWLLFKYNYVGCLLLLMFSIDCCLQSKGTRISSRQQDFWFPEHQKLDGWRKAANMLAQTSHWNRVRKPAHYNSVKQKYKQCKSWGQEKKK